ncbi:MAG TPA: alpha/beta hydrolase [Xanthobacteraceae bacterium]|nr:alpha/beta hydrolase [Xanthobacteraceae bacterium]
MTAIALLGLGLLGLFAATWLGTAVIERRHPPRGRFVDVTGGRMHVVDIGACDRRDGLPIVLLHGASANLEDMRVALGDRLAGTRRAILIDRPGHGWSDRPGGDADAWLARQAALVLETLDGLGVRRALVLGFSWSGALATALALTAPTRVAGLILLAPVTHPWRGGISWSYRLGVTPIVGPLFGYTLVLPIGRMLLAGSARKAFAPQPQPDNYVAHAAIALALRPAQFLANAHDVAALKAGVAAQAPRYPAIAAPTVIVTGDQDGKVPPRNHSQALAAVLPRARLVVLPGVGHMLHHAAKDAIVGEIERLAADAMLMRS